MALPAYNEELGIGKLLDKVQEVIKADTKEWEVLVVNDGSKDDTLGVLAEYAKKMPLTRSMYALWIFVCLRELTVKTPLKRLDQITEAISIGFRSTFDLSHSYLVMCPSLSKTLRVYIPLVHWRKLFFPMDDLPT